MFIVIFITFIIGSRWRDEDPIPPEASRGMAPPVWRSAIATVLVSALAFGPSLLAEALTQRSNDQENSAPINLTPHLEALDPAELHRPMISPVFVGTKASYLQTYRWENAELLLQIGYYRHQAQDKELINVNNKLEPTETWNWAGHRQLQFQNTAVKNLKVEKYVKSGTVVLATRLYWVGGFIVQSESYSKLLQALNIVIGKGDDAAAIVISASGTTEEEAKQALETFIQTHLNSILQELANTRQQLE